VGVDMCLDNLTTPQNVLYLRNEDNFLASFLLEEYSFSNCKVSHQNQYILSAMYKYKQFQLNPVFSNNVF